MHVTDHVDEYYAIRCLPFMVGRFVKALSRCRIELRWRQAVATTLQVWRILGQGLAANQRTEGRAMSGTYQGSPINLSLEQTLRGRVIIWKMFMAALSPKVPLLPHMILIMVWVPVLFLMMQESMCTILVLCLFPKGWSLAFIQDSNLSQQV